MIGTYIRGFRHFKRSVENLTKKEFLFIHGNRVYDGIAVKVDNKLFLFQNAYGERIGSYSEYDMNRNFQKLRNEISCKYSRELVIREKLIFELAWTIILLPDDFDSGYENFVNGNKKLLSPIFAKCCSKDDAIAHYFYTLCHDAPNLFAWAMNNTFKYGESLATLTSLIKWFKRYGSNSGKLSKGSITSYNNEQIALLENEAYKLRSEKRAKDVINTFNTTQKKLMKGVTLTPKHIITLSRFSNLSNAKKTNFIQKMSTIEDVDEIFTQMAYISNVHFEWNKDAFMNYIKNTTDEVVNCDIVFDKNNVVVVKAKTYDTIKNLAKNTNWCISKNKRYWNEYVEHRSRASQYVIFNFNKKEDDELSIVGFTVDSGKGITNAHSFTNNNLMGESTDYCVDTWLRTANNINDIINILGIPRESFMTQRKSRFPWNKEGFFHFLEHCIEKNYEVISDNDNKVVLTTSSKNIRFFFGKEYENVYEYGVNEKSKHFLFIDFNKREDDVSRVIFAIIGFDESKSEEYCAASFNAVCQYTKVSFDKLLEDNHLPYDTICRVNDDINKFYSSLEKYDVDTISLMLKNEEIMKLFKAKKNAKNRFDISEYLNNSIFDKKSLGLINMFYENGFKLCDISTPRDVGGIVNSLMSNMAVRFSRSQFSTSLPTDDDFKRLLNGEFDREVALGVGFFFTTKLILENEDNQEFADRVMRSLGNNIVNFDFARMVIDNMYHHLNYSKVSDGVYRLVTISSSIRHFDVLFKILNEKETLNVAEDVIEFINNQIPRSVKEKQKEVLCAVTV